MTQPLMDVVEIRDERMDDREIIRALHVEAFGGDVEARLVDLLREREKAIVSLVGVVRDEIVAHILFSPVTIDGASTALRAVGLAPVSVRPTLQRQGIGSMLIRAGLDRCERRGYGVAVVLGDPAYYMRFGFRPAKGLGLENEYGVGDEFMVMELRKGALETTRGLVRYAPEFREAEG